MSNRKRRRRFDNDEFVADWDTPEWRAKNVETNRLLIQRFPELADAYEREVVATDSEDDGPHVIYSLVFDPFLERALLTEPADSPLLGRIFAFLMFLEEGDDDLRNLATVGVGEFLEDNPKILERALPRLGPVMRAAIEESMQ